MSWLSIVVPTWNEAQNIVPLMNHLQALRARGVEVIVADGGSHDGTPALAETLADRVLTVARGRARQMNAGAAHATGDALLFLHADTRLPTNADWLISAALSRSAWGRFDVRIAGRPTLLRLVAAMMNLRSCLSGIATGDQAMFMTRAAFHAAGGFPGQPLMEDIELSRRLKEIGRPACIGTPVVTSGRRWERHGVWRTIFLMWRLRWAYWCGVAPAQLARRYVAPERERGR